MLGYLEEDWNLKKSTTSANLYRGDSGFAAAPFGMAELGFGFLVAPDIQIQFGYQGGYEFDVLHTAVVCENADNNDIRPDIPSCANNDEDAGVLNYGPFMRLNAYF